METDFFGVKTGFLGDVSGEKSESSDEESMRVGDEIICA